jgi:hypothetical protein
VTWRFGIIPIFFEFVFSALVVGAGLLVYFKKRKR